MVLYFATLCLQVLALPQPAVNVNAVLGSGGMPAAFEDVPLLSDDEGGDLVTPVRAPSKRQDASTQRKTSPCWTRRTLLQCKVPRKMQAKPINHLGRVGLVARTRAIIQGKCRCSMNRRCKQNCFEPFREPSVFELLVQRLRTFASMDKIEIDKEVGWTGLLGWTGSLGFMFLLMATIDLFLHDHGASICFLRLLLGVGVTSTTYNGNKLDRLLLMGFPVCQHAYKRLLRLGSDRFMRLCASVRSGDSSCPHDMRYVSKKFGGGVRSKKRQLVHDFLHELYETLAEPMPEGTGASKRPRTVKKRDDKLMVARTNLIEKALPPGSFHEYLCMLPTETFSYKIFCSASALALQCSTCSFNY